MLNGFVTNTLATAASGRYFVKFLRNSLYANSVYLMLSSAVRAGLGFGFWIAVARLYRASDVGLAAGLISAASLLALLATLGLDYGLIRFLAGSGDKARRLLNSVFTLSGLLGLAAAAIFIAGIPIWSPALNLARQHPAYIVGFIGLVPALAIMTMVNGGFVGSRRSSLVLLCGSLSGILRLVFALGLVVLFGTFGIFASWGLAVGVALVLSILLILPRLYAGYRPIPVFNGSGMKEVVRYSFLNYLTLLFWSAPLYLLPLIVVNRLGAEANAYFFIAMSMAGLVWAIPVSVSLSLLAEGSHDEGQLQLNLQRSAWITGVLLVPAILLIWVLGDKLLLAFGTAYSQEATEVLRILGLAAIPVAINSLYLGVRRVQKRLKGPIGLTWSIALITIVSSLFMLPSMGILGAGIALLGANGAGALWVLWQLMTERMSRETASG